MVLLLLPILSPSPLPSKCLLAVRCSCCWPFVNPVKMYDRTRVIGCLPVPHSACSLEGGAGEGESHSLILVSTDAVSPSFDSGVSFDAVVPVESVDFVPLIPRSCILPNASARLFSLLRNRLPQVSCQQSRPISRKVGPSIDVIRERQSSPGPLSSSSSCLIIHSLTLTSHVQSV